MVAPLNVSPTTAGLIGHAVPFRALAALQGGTSAGLFQQLLALLGSGLMLAQAEGTLEVAPTADAEGQELGPEQMAQLASLIQALMVPPGTGQETLAAVPGGEGASKTAPSATGGEPSTGPADAARPAVLRLIQAEGQPGSPSARSGVDLIPDAPGQGQAASATRVAGDPSPAGPAWPADADASPVRTAGSGDATQPEAAAARLQSELAGAAPNAPAPKPAGGPAGHKPQGTADGAAQGAQTGAEAMASSRAPAPAANGQPGGGEAPGGHRQAPARPPAQAERLEPAVEATSPPRATDLAGTGPGRAAGEARGGQETPEPVHMQIANRLTELGGGQGSVRLRLSPPELGGVEVRLALREGQLQVHIRAEQPAAYRLVETRLSELVSALQGRGVPVSSVQVSLGDAGRGHGEPGSGGWPGRAHGAGALPAQEEPEELQALAGRRSRVDYRA